MWFNPPLSKLFKLSRIISIFWVCICMSRLRLVLRTIFGQQVIKVLFHLLGYAIELIDVGLSFLLIQVRRTQFLSLL